MNDGKIRLTTDNKHMENKLNNIFGGAPLVHDMSDYDGPMPTKLSWWERFLAWLRRNWLKILMFLLLLSLLLLLLQLLRGCSQSNYGASGVSVGQSFPGTGFSGAGSSSGTISGLPSGLTSGDTGIATNGTNGMGIVGTTSGEGIQVTNPGTRGEISRKSWDGFVVTPEQVVNESTMTRYAQMLFYHANPEIVPEDKFELEHYCGSRSDSAGTVLGCYIPTKSQTKDSKDGGGGVASDKETDTDYIFIRQFNDKKLLPEMYVTASHEMLHAGWYHSPLNYNSSKERIKDLLLDYYHNSPDLQKRMEPYRQNGLSENSDDYLSELHSIICTEYSDIGDELELYYSIYFNDRRKIVNYHKSTVG